MIRILSSLLSLLLLCGQVNRELPDINDRFFSSFLIDHWNTSKGLPSNSLMDIYQTSDSFIWITSFNGLIKFDGVNFTVFNKNNLPNLATNGFRHIFEDHNKNIWFGTVGAGILRFKDNHFHLFTPESDQFTARKAIVDDQDNTIWIATNNHGVFNLVDSVYKKVEWPEFEGVIINDIAECHSKVIWFATEGHGLSAYKDGKFYVFKDKLMSNEIKTLAISPSNNIWVGTINGLSKIYNSKITNYPQFRNVEINAIFVEDDRYLWMAAKQGLYIFDTKTNRHVSIKEFQGINITGLTRIIQDREGSYWITSESMGLLRLRRGKFMNFTKLDGLSTDRINTVLEYDKSTYLIGTDDGKIQQVKNDRVSPFDLKNEFPDVRIKQIMKDRSGDLWISSDAGLIHKRGAYEKLYSTVDGFPTNQIRFQYEDSRGWKWIGTRNGGVVRLKSNGEMTIFNMEHGLSSNFIFSAIEDRQGRILITTRDGGINRIDLEDKITIFYGLEGMVGNSIFNAYQDYDDNIFLCSNAGLMRFRDEKFKVLTAENGLPLESIFDI
ncbi:MAG: hypothetical protein KDD94_13770, partial [Calditrichaeota bacterium]|nr:hypothetical protein [Calditrichota bacterium]